ncbi:MAG: DUF1385 domain-containing protein [Armatimonadetes bacterium]|nr:DUF1385 domain-containing protein [Armatimonadota bacterium]
MAKSGAGQEVMYGGQAVIEGVMIRSPRYIAVACRLPEPDGKPGRTSPIDIHTEPVRSLFLKRPWLRKLPLVRGMVSLFEMLGLGLRSLERSANIQAAFLQVIAPLLCLATPAKQEKGALNGPLMAGTIAVAFTFGFALFVLLPNWVADLLGRWLGFGDHSLALNLVEGLLRLLIFVGYITAIGLMPDIRRVFQYHGAEHKVVNAYEAGVPLNIEQSARMSVIHPRCGTNFAFLVIVLSIVVFSFLPWTSSLLERVGMRLLCLPLVAGIGFELIRFVGTRREVAWLQALIAPGLWLQKLTTREPDPDMIEVALASFNAVKLAEETDELTTEVRGEARQRVEFPAETAGE